MKGLRQWPNMKTIYKIVNNESVSFVFSYKEMIKEKKSLEHANKDPCVFNNFTITKIDQNEYDRLQLVIR